MSNVFTNTPRPGETAEQTAARSAPREPHSAFEPAVRPAKLFYLTEPARGVFVVNVQIDMYGGMITTGLVRLEITRDQLANFLVDGTAMALRDVTGKGQ
jgi:hypothetical protein